MKHSASIGDRIQIQTTRTSGNKSYTIVVKKLLPGGKYYGEIVKGPLAGHGVRGEMVLPSAESGLIVGRTDINGREGERAIINGKVWKVGGGEIILNEKTSKKHCKQLSKWSQEDGGIAFDCDQQKVANYDRASGAMPKDEYHQEAAGGANASDGLKTEGDVSYIIKVLQENPFYTEKGLSFTQLAPLVDLVIREHLIHDKNNPIVTRFNESVYFEPSDVHYKRDGFRKSIVEYATHFITGDSYQGNVKKRTFDKSKMDALQFLIPVLKSPDVQRLHQLSDPIKKRKDAIVYAKEILLGKGLCVVLVAEINNHGVIRGVAFLPKNKRGYIEKQKASNVWLDAPVVFSPSSEKPPSEGSQTKKASGGVSLGSIDKHTKNNATYNITLYNTKLHPILRVICGKTPTTEDGTPITVDRMYHIYSMEESAACGTQKPPTMSKESFDTIAADKTITKKEKMIRLYRAGATRKEIKTLAKANAGEVSNAIKAAEADIKKRTDRAMRMWDEELTAASGAQIPDRYKAMGFTEVGHMMDSTKPEKKWMVLAKKGDQYKVVHGGQKGMEDFSQHKDEARRRRFWKRMGGEDSAQANDPFSPLYWHKKYGTWAGGGVADTGTGPVRTYNTVIKKEIEAAKKKMSDMGYTGAYGMLEKYENKSLSELVDAKKHIEEISKNKFSLDASERLGAINTLIKIHTRLHTTDEADVADTGTGPVRSREYTFLAIRLQNPKEDLESLEFAVKENRAAGTITQADADWLNYQIKQKQESAEAGVKTENMAKKGMRIIDPNLTYTSKEEWEKAMRERYGDVVPVGNEGDMTLKDAKIKYTKDGDIVTAIYLGEKVGHWDYNLEEGYEYEDPLEGKQRVPMIDKIRTVDALQDLVNAIPDVGSLFLLNRMAPAHTTLFHGKEWGDVRLNVSKESLADDEFVKKAVSLGEYYKQAMDDSAAAGTTTAKELMEKSTREESLESKYANLIKWNDGFGTNKDVEDILDALIRAGVTDKSLHTKPTKTGSQYLAAKDIKTDEIFKKMKKHYTGSFEGNQGWGIIGKMVDHANIYNDNIIERYQNSKSAASGAQPQKTTPMNLYYLKDGNKLKDSYNNTFEIVGHSFMQGEGIQVKRLSDISEFESDPVQLDFTELVSKMNDKKLIIEGCPYETDRDKALLLNEIDAITKAYEAEDAEYKANKERISREAAEAKLIETAAAAEKERGKFGDTIKGMEALAGGGPGTTRNQKISTNKYIGHSPMVVWNSWTKKQRQHFLTDHDAHNIASMDGILDKYFYELPDNVQEIVTRHVQEGSYAAGKGQDSLPANAEAFLSQFPDNAASWADATDEIRDMARTAKEYYNEITLDVLSEDPKGLKPLDFRSLKTPSQWNTQGKKYIRDTYKKMNAQAREQFLERFSHWFSQSAASGKSNLGDKYDGMGQKEKRQRMRAEDLIFEGASCRILRGRQKDKVGIVVDWDEEENQVDVKLPSGEMWYPGYEDIEILASPPLEEAASGTISPAKAKKILKDGTAHGKPLTKKQKKFFRAKANAAGGKKVEWLVESADGHRKIVATVKRPKIKRLYTTTEEEGGKKIIVSKVIGKAPKAAGGMKASTGEKRRLLKLSKLSSEQYQIVKDMPGAKEYFRWNEKEQLYVKKNMEV